MADAQIAIIDGDQTQVVLAPGENPAIVSSIPGPQGPAGAGVPLGGTTNQVLFKQSGTNYDTAWGPITSAMIGDLEIVNADVSASAAIAGTKISPNFGSQNVVTTGTSTAASFIPSSSTVPTNGLYLSAANSVALSTNGNGRLFIDASGNVGVGTVPSYLLHLNSSGAAQARVVTSSSTSVAQWYAENTTGASISIAATGSGYTPFGVININNGYIYSGSDLALASTSEIKIGSGPSALERLRITSTGQLSHIGAGSSGSPAVSFSGSAASNSLVVDSSSRVGVGTSSPSYRLDVQVSPDTTLAATADGILVNGILAGGNRPFGLLHTGNSYSYKGVGASRNNIYSNGTLAIQSDGGSIEFCSGANLNAVLDSSGRLGIGTSSPGYPLDVLAQSSQAAAARFRGNIAGSNNVQIRFYGANAATDQWAIGNAIATGDATRNFDIYDLVSNANRLRIDSSGRVGIGTTSPGYLLDLSASTPVLNITSSASSGDGAQIRFVQNFGRVGRLYLTSESGLGSGSMTLESPDGRHIIFSHTSSERARIDNLGRLLVGTSSARSNFYNGSTYTPRLQLESANSGANSSIALVSAGNSAFNEANLIFAKSRGNAVGDNTIVVDGDDIGTISFQASDGSEYVVAAHILAEVDGTPGANDMPGRLVFSTTSDASASPTERLRITSAGVLQVADAGNIAVGTTTGTKIGTATTQKLGFFNATPVVQPAAVADATDAASVITQLNALLARMRDLGLIAT